MKHQQRDIEEFFYTDGQLYRWKSDNEKRSDFRKAVDAFFPGVQDAKTRHRILEVELQRLDESIDIGWRALMRKVVRRLWAQTHDLEKAIILFNQKLGPYVGPGKDRCLELLKIGFNHLQKKSVVHEE